ncbi:MAG: hypothetical protein MZW92_57370 [Comamonadaceae bacterium]|nr:hypothetical protein [Comamonadaceae bacterium]
MTPVTGASASTQGNGSTTKLVIAEPGPIGMMLTKASTGRRPASSTSRSGARRRSSTGSRSTSSSSATARTATSCNSSGMRR